MREVRTYEVTTQGFPPYLYSARRPAQAPSQAYSSYRVGHDATFMAFLKISRCTRAPNPPGVGHRILVGGLPATRCISKGEHYVWFMRDDSDVILCSHPADVVDPMPVAPGWLKAALKDWYAPDDIDTWFNSKQKLLGGTTPRAIIDGGGEAQVRRLIDQMESGAYL